MFFAASLGTLLVLSQGSATAQMRPDVPMCRAGQLNLSAGGGDDLNGMSHGGTYLTLKNVSAQECRVSPMPRLTFLDRRNQTLKAQFEVQGARMMHPGPVVLPVVLAPGDTLTNSLRWVSGPVYGDNGGYKLQPAFVVLQLEKGSIRSRLTATMYGESKDSVKVEMTRFLPKP